MGETPARALGVIVAGGFATRMGEASARLPKALLPVAGVSVLERQVQQFRRAGIEEIVVLAGHLGEQIAAVAESLAKVEVRIEDRPLGSGGCLRSLGELDRPAVVALGDVLFELDLRELLAVHRGAGEALITAAVHPNEHPHDSDLVEVDGEGRVLALHAKPHPPGARLRNLVIAGLFVIEPELLATLPPLMPGERPAKLDLVQDLLAGALVRARSPRVRAWQTTAYLKDMGTPRRYAEAQADFRRGVPARRRQPRPTVFVDRDGTLNRHVGYLRRPEQLELLPGVAEAVAELNRAQVQVVVVTNQPVIARGEVAEAGLAAIHAELETQLGRAGAFVDRIYHCPHHPDAGFAGERPELKRACACRKPGTGMIDAAMAELLVDRERSLLIGDHRRDLEAALAAGLRPVLVGDASRGLAEARGVAWFSDFAHACRALLSALVETTPAEAHAC